MAEDEEEEVEAAAEDRLVPGRSELKDCPEERLCIRRRETLPAREWAARPDSCWPCAQRSTNL